MCPQHEANGRPRSPVGAVPSTPGEERSSSSGYTVAAEGGFAVTEPVETAEGRQTEPLRVLLVDDHDLFGTGLRNLLEGQALEIVGEAATGAEAVAQVSELAPDVVVMDLNMPSMGGVEATRHIAEVAPLTRVVMLTISDEDSDVTDAILAGA